MLPDAPLDDLLDVFDGLVVVLQAVVAQGDVVGQRWRGHKQEDGKGDEVNICGRAILTNHQIQPLQRTRHRSHQLQDRGEHPAGLLVLAVLVEQTAHVVGVVWVLLGQLHQQGLHTHTELGNNRGLHWAAGYFQMTMMNVSVCEHARRHLGSRVILLAVLDAGLQLQHLTERHRQAQRAARDLTTPLRGKSNLAPFHSCIFELAQIFPQTRTVPDQIVLTVGGEMRLFW